MLVRSRLVPLTFQFCLNHQVMVCAAYPSQPSTKRSGPLIFLMPLVVCHKFTMIHMFIALCSLFLDYEVRTWLPSPTTQTHFASLVLATQGSPDPCPFSGDLTHHGEAWPERQGMARRAGAAVLGGQLSWAFRRHGWQMSAKCDHT